MVKRDLLLTQLGFMEFIYNIYYVDVIIHEALFAFISILTKSPMYYFSLSPFGLHQLKYCIFIDHIYKYEKFINCRNVSQL